MVRALTQKSCPTFSTWKLMKLLEVDWTINKIITPMGWIKAAQWNSPHKSNTEEWWIRCCSCCFSPSLQDWCRTASLGPSPERAFLNHPFSSFKYFLVGQRKWFGRFKGRAGLTIILWGPTVTYEHAHGFNVFFKGLPNSHAYLGCKYIISRYRNLCMQHRLGFNGQARFAQNLYCL